MFLVTIRYISDCHVRKEYYCPRRNRVYNEKSFSRVMKLLAVFAIFIVLTYVSASLLPAVYDGPTYELVTVDEPEYDEVSDQAPIRNRRVTCDLLSWQSKWLTINHSACAAKCLAQRRRGGRCRDGVCICRK